MTDMPAPRVFESKQPPDVREGDVSRWARVEPEPLVMTIEQLVPRGMLTLKVSPGGVGKSLLAQVALTAVGTGRPFLGMPTLFGPAVGVFCEDPDNLLHIRQERINAHYGLDMADLVSRVYVSAWFGKDCLLWSEGKPTDRFDELGNQLADIKPSLAEIDNTAMVYGGNENDRLEVTRFLSALNGMAADVGCGLLMTHHTSKSYDAADPSKLASGTTAWVNAARSVLELRPGQNDDDPVELRVRKANHFKKPKPIFLAWTDAGLLLPVRNDDPIAKGVKRRELDAFLFHAIDARWRAGGPLSNTASQRDRYAPRIIAAKNGVAAGDVSEAIGEWLERGNLAVTRLNARTPIGLRVIDWPSHVMQQTITEAEHED